MPLYDYKCQECGEIIENVIQSINDDKFETAGDAGGCKCGNDAAPIKRMLCNGGAWRNDKSDLRGRGYQVTKGSGGRRY
jgi:predicted nucleic acid-binding Zn ribbon protein